jgi:hypothetical protein
MAWSAAKESALRQLVRSGVAYADGLLELGRLDDDAQVPAAVDRLVQELASAERTVTQQRGPITDTWKADESGRRLGRATVSCVHGKTWPEGGYGCEPCMAESRRLRNEGAWKYLGEEA